MIRKLPMIALLLSLTAVADTYPSNGMLLVGNKSAHTLWVLDATTGEKIGEFPTGTGPHEVEVSPDGRLAVVTNYGGESPGNSLTVIDITGHQVERTIDLGDHRRPHGIGFRPGGELVVTTEDSDHLLVVDIESGEVVSEIAVGKGTAHMVAVGPEGRHAWVTNISAGTLEKVDLKAGEVVGSTATGNGAEGVAVARGGREIWVTNRGDDTISVVAADNLETLATLESTGFPIRVVMTPDGRHALVTNARAATLSVFDTGKRELIARVGIADPDAEYRDTLLGRAALPIGIEIHPDGSRAYVAVSDGDEVAVIDTGSWAITQRWSTGREPDALGIVIGR